MYNLLWIFKHVLKIRSLFYDLLLFEMICLLFLKKKWFSNDFYKRKYMDKEITVEIIFDCFFLLLKND